MPFPVGIIGAGPAGISAAVALKQRAIPVEIVDAGERVGGIWDIERAETPMYDAAQFISSRTLSAFPGFPMPADYPDYPRHDQILRYIRSYADHHGITDRVELRTRVEGAVHAPGDNSWDVELSTGERRTWSALIVATGTNWYPNMPAVPGTFDGQQMHSFAFRSPDVFTGKRVLIVGGGNSGVDIACEAARHASRAFISLRRGYHFIPKYVFGKPSDVFAHTGPQLPWRLEEIVFGLLINRVLVGDLRKYGLPKPNHPILRSHPIMNTQVLEHFKRSELHYRPDVQELRGRRVVFTDGREEDIDLIVWATGYERRFPFLDKQATSPTSHVTRPTSQVPGQSSPRPDLYLELFHRADPTLFFMGVFEVDGAAYPLHGLQAKAIASYLSARANAPQLAAGFDADRASARPDLRGGRPYLKSLRHKYYVRGDVYERELKRACERLGTTQAAH
jgi:cation diffusion facilitator CzcD-associated flavoprotein CzcO